jgi:alpha-D-ribose 1-methylphosphonate 5-triphosphate synthase subunit PhnH
MITVPTYQGVVHEGKIQLTPAADLPEGSQVVVLATGDWTQPTLLDPHIARRKANGWLVTHVGSVMAQQPQLHQVDGQLAWRFKAFLTGRSQPARGPLGVIDVDAYSGEILTDIETASEMIANAKAIVRSLSSSE